MTTITLNSELTDRLTALAAVKGSSPEEAATSAIFSGFGAMDEQRRSASLTLRSGPIARRVRTLARFEEMDAEALLTRLVETSLHTLAHGGRLLPLPEPQKSSRR